MEYVDIVNEKNEVVGRSSKQEAHEKGLLHRTVVAEVIGSDGRLTLVKQADDRQDPGQYVSPVGGHVRAGESEDEALKREAEEELGLKGDLNYQLIGRKIFNREACGRKENHYFVLYEIYSDEEPVLNYESVGYKRFSEDQLSKELKKSPQKFGAAFHFIVENFYQRLR